MTLLFLALWLQMSAPQIDFKVSTIDNINDFCASSAQCFPVLIDPSAEGYGPLKGTPDKGKIACEVKKDHMRCINAFGATVTLNFDDAGEVTDRPKFDWIDLLAISAFLFGLWVAVTTYLMRHP